ncbi:undecaprenyl-diphosphatase UppP [Candidatus Falkowbacteria bacterium]|nr:undecaprenyl-diphosphatase UppP [Candidatus Falkowbacteria bacterium]
MEYISAIIFGVVQGVTEFLPVSSSGHLLVLHRLLALPIKDEVAFDVSLHLATFVAVLWFFRKDVVSLALRWLRSFRYLPGSLTDLSWLIIFATIPAGLAGLLWEDTIETVLRSPLLVAFMLVLVGILFIVVERVGKQSQELSQLTLRQAMIIGLSQALALIPGTSRSGITTISGMGLNLKRTAAIRFSFLLSLPIIAGAALKKVPYLFESGLEPREWTVVGLAFVAAVISGWLAIAMLLHFTQKHSLRAFAYYRFVLAFIIIFLMFFSDVFN